MVQPSAAGTLASAPEQAQAPLAEAVSSTPENVASVAAERAVAETENPAPAEMRVSSGVLFGIKIVPPLLIRRAMQGVPKPRPPRVWIEEKGREEENPLDPGYLAAVEEWEETQSDAVIRAMLLAGTWAKEIPEGVPAIESEDWVEMLDAVEMPAPVRLATKSQRYLAWVQFVACTSAEDLLALGVAVGRATGLSEGDVMAAIDSFRSDQGRIAADRASALAGATNGDRLPAADTRPRAGDRRA